MRATRAYGPSSGEIVKLDSDMTGAAQRGDEAAPLTTADARRSRRTVVNKDVVPDEGIEPPTFGLQNRCSTAELIRRVAGFALPASRAARKSGTL